MTKAAKSLLIDKGIGALVTAFVGLLAYWFGSAGSLQALEYRIDSIEKIEKTYAKKTDLKLVLSGLCIIDKRTCQLHKGISK